MTTYQHWLISSDKHTALRRDVNDRGNGELSVLALQYSLNPKLS